MPCAVVVLLTGPPGTGKSTLAERAAEVLGAAVFGWDWVMAGMTSFEPVQTALAGLGQEEYRRVGWSILWNLATAQLRQGRSVVLDGVARDPEVAGTRALARAEGATAIVVATSCRDRGVHRRRIEGRRRDIPGWHELDWDHVAGVVDRWRDPVGTDLRLDALAPKERNGDALVAAIAKARSRTD